MFEFYHEPHKPHELLPHNLVLTTLEWSDECWLVRGLFFSLNSTGR
jgi:hypothetical protein